MEHVTNACTAWGKVDSQEISYAVPRCHTARDRKRVFLLHTSGVSISLTEAMSLKNAFKRATPGLTAESGQEPSHSNGGSRAGSNAGSDVEAEDNAEKYLLRVTAGPSYDPSTHRVVAVNGHEPTSFESDAMSTQIRVRIKGYQGVLLSVDFINVLSAGLTLDRTTT